MGHDTDCKNGLVNSNHTYFVFAWREGALHCRDLCSVHEWITPKRTKSENMRTNFWMCTLCLNLMIKPPGCPLCRCRLSLSLSLSPPFLQPTNREQPPQVYVMRQHSQLTFLSPGSANQLKISCCVRVFLSRRRRGGGKACILSGPASTNL